MRKLLKYRNISIAMYCFLLCLTLSPTKVNSQVVEWINELEDSVGLGSYYYKETENVFDSDNNYYTSISVNRQRPFTMFNKQFYGRDSFTDFYFVKLNPDGELLSYIKIRPLQVRSNQFQINMCIIDSGIYIMVRDAALLELYKNDVVSDSVNLLSTKRQLSLIKLNMDGDVKWVRRINSKYDYTGGNPLLNINRRTTLKEFGSDNIYITFIYSVNSTQGTDSLFIQSDSINQLVLFDSTFVSGYPPNCDYVNLFKATFSQSGDLVEFTPQIIDSFNFFDLQRPYYTDHKNLQIALLTCPKGGFWKGGIYFNPNKMHFGVLDSNNKFQPKISSNSHSASQVERYKTYSREHFLLSFKPYHWNQSINFTLDTLVNHVENKQYPLDTLEFTLFNKQHEFVRKKRLFRIDSYDSISIQFEDDLAFHDQFIFIKGRVFNNSSSKKNILADGILYEIPPLRHVPLLMKIDTMLNVLWLRLDTSIMIGSPYYSGHFNSDLEGNLYYNVLIPPNIELIFWGDTIKAKSHSSSALIKVTDYFINRGDVLPGPYCAGDSFDIPYTIQGRFDTSNYFIAQLSDEHGEFIDTSKIRDLGKIKATSDSTIRAGLPMFQVYSSGRYRIRIISTNPPVQSFYRRDSLRLLVYSIDKADPGPPETVCFGAPFMLNTFGGTSWQWSPSYNMDDSAKRSPFIIPDKDTVYRIIISDSSGCGDIDTAFKQIFIRPNPKVSIIDSIEACHNKDIQLEATFSEGDSTRYFWTWFRVANDSTWQKIYTDSLASTHILNYRLPNDVLTSVKLAVVLDDDCSVVKDTGFVLVKLSSQRLKSEISSLDSVYCYMDSVHLFTNFSGGDSSSYSWKWFEIDKQNQYTLLKEGDSSLIDSVSTVLSPQIFDFKDFALVSKDGCTPFLDTQFYTATIFKSNPKSSISPMDTLVCDNSEIRFDYSLNNYSGKGIYWQMTDELGNIVKGGSNYEKEWFDYPILFDTFTLRSYKIYLTDQCSQESDTTSISIRKIQRKPIVDLESIGGLVCPQQEIVLLSKVDTSWGISYVWEWFDENGTLLIKDTAESFSQQTFIPMFEFSKNTSYSVVVTSLCNNKKDTAQIILSAPSPLQINVNENEIVLCKGQPITFTAKGFGGVPDDYKWQWNNKETNEILSTDSFITISFQDSIFILNVILSDACMPQNDTSEIKINVRPPLRSYILNSTLDSTMLSEAEICFGSKMQFFTQTTGGDSTKYQYSWFVNDSLISINENIDIDFKKEGSQQITLITTDNCTVANDTQGVLINVIPALEISFTTPDTLCSGQEIQLTSEPFGGVSENYTYQWIASYQGSIWEIIGSDSTLSYTPQLEEKIKLKLVLNDGCSLPDTLTKEIIIRPALEITISPNTQCANPDILLTANPKGGNSSTYLIQWFDENDTFIGEGLTQIVTPSFLTTYKVVLSDACSKLVAESQIQVDKKPQILNLDIHPIEGCQSLIVEFNVQTSYPNNYTYTIYTGTGDSIIGTQDQTKFEYSYLLSGKNTPNIILTTELGCEKIVLGNEIDVWPKPIASFSYSPDAPRIDKPIVTFQNKSILATNYSWEIEKVGEFTDFEPIVTFEDTGRYLILLYAITDKGCRDTAEGEVYIRMVERIFIPTAFSPNGDGVNDVFEPVVRGFDILELNIFNRWGEKIFSSQGQGWNGMYKGELAQQGVYTYTLLLVDENGEKKLFTGTVTLVR